MVGKKEHHERRSELGVEGRLLEKLSPAVKMAISRAAGAVGQSAWPSCSRPALTYLPEPSQRELNGVVIVLALIFGKAAHLLSIQRSGNRFPLPLPSELLLSVLSVARDPVNRAQCWPIT